MQGLRQVHSHACHVVLATTLRRPGEERQPWSDGGGCFKLPLPQLLQRSMKLTCQQWLDGISTLPNALFARAISCSNVAFTPSRWPSCRYWKDGMADLESMKLACQLWREGFCVTPAPTDLPFWAVRCFGRSDEDEQLVDMGSISCCCPNCR